MNKKVGIVGVGAIGTAVAKALINGIDGFTLDCLSDVHSIDSFDVICTDIDTLIQRVDLVIECLPANIVPELAGKVFQQNKDIIFISSAALLLYPQIVDDLKSSDSKAYLPSGALCGLDGVLAMQEMGIVSSKIASTNLKIIYNQ